MTERMEDGGGGLLSGVIYGATLPERLVRGMIGSASGVLRESARAAVPDSMKGMKLYELTVRKTLRILVEDIGGMKTEPAAGLPPQGASKGVNSGHPGAPELTAPPSSSESLALKTAVAGAVDLAGVTTLHLSPLWLFAVVSDVSLGARTYLNAIVDELKAQGVLDRSDAVESIDDLLGSLQRLSGTVADRLDAPPVTLDELRRSVADLRAESSRIDVRKLYPSAEVDRLWREIQETASREGCSIFQVSSAMALLAFQKLSVAGKGVQGSFTAGFRLIDENVFGYYSGALARIRERGYYQTLAETYEPYLRSLKLLFDPSRETYTEEALRGRLFQRFWSWLRSLFGGRTETGASPPTEAA